MKKLYSHKYLAHDVIWRHKYCQIWPLFVNSIINFLNFLNFLFVCSFLIFVTLNIHFFRGYHHATSKLLEQDNLKSLQNSKLLTTESLPLYVPNYLQNPIPQNCYGILCGKHITSNSSLAKDELIIVITPTKKRYERIPDLTRFSQTLMHIKNLHWIVIEDGTQIVDSVYRLLKRTNISFAYFFAAKQPNLRPKGWTQRNDALKYLRKYYRNFDGHAVIYFADDDNAYDIRLFNDFIRNVKHVGVWPVGLVGGAIVEGPIVKDKKVISWHAQYKPNRTFAIDMAGFGVSLNLIHSTNVSFGIQCINEAPEDCFLKQLEISKNDLEPFGYTKSFKDVLVWHTNTHKTIILSKNNYGFDAEIED